MRRLILLRHAKTEAQAASGRDFDRALDARGIDDAAAIGQWLASQQEPPARVLVSTAVRAQQTWRAVAGELSHLPDVKTVASLYNASPTDLMQALRGHGGDATPLMIVAHNPGLHELAIALTGDGDAAARRALDDNLPTSALVTLDFDTEAWSEAGFRRGRLMGFVSPKTLRETETPQP